jgi:competence protein ComFC
MAELIPGIPPMKSEFWKKTWNLLFAGGTRCGLCENVHSDPWNGICPSCFDTIPWLCPGICEICGRSMTDKERCMDCVRRENTPFVCNRSAVQYEEPVKSWLHQYKFKGLQRMAAPLSEMMLQAYWLHYADLRFDALTFIPLHQDRERERGFNQAKQLAKIISRRARIPMIELLIRHRSTDKQSQKGRSSRLTLLQGAFEFKQDGNGQGVSRDDRTDKRRHILLIDDVYTST